MLYAAAAAAAGDPVPGGSGGEVVGSGSAASDAAAAGDPVPGGSGGHQKNLNPTCKNPPCKLGPAPTSVDPVSAAAIGADRARQRGGMIQSFKEFIGPKLMEHVVEQSSENPSDQATIAKAQAAGAAVHEFAASEHRDQIDKLQDSKNDLEQARAQAQARGDQAELARINEVDQKVDHELERQEESLRQNEAMRNESIQVAGQAQEENKKLATYTPPRGAAEFTSGPVAGVAASGVNGGASASAGSTTGNSLKDDPGNPTPESVEMAATGGPSAKEILKDALSKRLAEKRAKEAAANGGASMAPTNADGTSAVGGGVSGPSEKFAMAVNGGGSQDKRRGANRIRLSSSDSDREVKGILDDLMANREEGRSLASVEEDDRSILGEGSADLFARVSEAIDKLAPTRGLVQ